MENRAEEFERWLNSRTDSDWRQIAGAARAAEVGGWRWEEAWAALGPQVLERELGAVACEGKDPLAWAAALGALAALRAGAHPGDRYAVLLAPFAHELSVDLERNLEAAISV